MKLLPLLNGLRWLVTLKIPYADVPYACGGAITFTREPANQLSSRYHLGGILTRQHHLAARLTLATGQQSIAHQAVGKTGKRSSVRLTSQSTRWSVLRGQRGPAARFVTSRWAIFKFADAPSRRQQQRRLRWAAAALKFAAMSESDRDPPREPRREIPTRSVKCEWTYFLYVFSLNLWAALGEDNATG